MNLRAIYICISAVATLATATAQESTLLNGTVIGSQAVDYSTGLPSTTVNTPACAFDGSFSTYYASYDRSFTWVGLELDQPYIITKVGYAARNDSQGEKRMLLGCFQGANQPDFSDALPIYLIPENGKKNQMTYAEVSCSRGFKYVRYVGPRDARCNVAELEFYGYPGEGDDNSLYQVTNLPLVVVNTPNMEWFHENDKSYELNGSQISIIKDGKFDVNSTGQVRGRGNASWDFPKKPFRIKFDSKQKVLGGPAKAKKWTMINNYGDKTLMRNKLAFDISERLGLAYTPVCHFVDLIFNGEYEGTYQLCDQIEINSKRVNITEMEPTDTEGEALTGGYLVEIDAYANQEAPDEYFYTNRGYTIPVTIKSPDPGVDAQYNYIKGKMSTLTSLVYGVNFTDPERGYRKALDLESFLKHFIVGELSGNMDTYWSVYMTLERGEEQFKTGPVWDFDLAFDNDTRIYPVNSKNDFIFKSGSAAGDMKAFVTRIIDKDTEAREQLTYLWSYARELQDLDADIFCELVDTYAEELQQSQVLNFKRWPIMNQYVHQNPRIWGSYTAEVNNVKNYLRNRFNKLDNLIGRCEISGVNDIESTDADAPTEVFNLQGISLGSDLSSLPAGLYIVRRGSTTTKVIKK